MADGSITAVIEVDDSKAQADLNKLEKRITNLQNKLSEQKYQRMPLADEAARLGNELEAAKQKLSEMGSGGSRITYEEIQRQAEAVNNLTAMYNKASGALERQDASIKKTELSLEYAKEKAGDLSKRLIYAGDSGASAGDSISNAMQAATVRMAKFERRIIGLARRVFIFTLVTKAFRAMREQLWLGIKSNDQAAAAVARLKGALLTLAQPIIQTIIPAFVLLVNVLTKVVTTIADLFSRLTGKTFQQSADAAKALYGEQKALNGVGAAAKKAGKQLASFDEINKLEGSNSGVAGIGAYGNSIEPDFTSVIQSRLSDIEALFTGSALLALGAVLTFTGISPLLGIALMAAGAAFLWKAATTTFGELEKFVSTPIGRIIGLFTGVALLALGAVLAFTGVGFLLGLALMAAGAAFLWKAVTTNPDEAENTLKDPIKRVIGLFTGVALLALGAVLVFTGVAMPLGIALLAAGAVGLASAVAANWDAIVNALRGSIGKVTAIASGALLALGAVLLFTGVGIPLGLGLLLVGAAGLAAVVVPNWGAILGRLKQVWASIKNWWNTSVKKYFTAEYWSGLGKTIIDGLLNGMKSAWESVKSWGSSARDWLREKFSFGSTVSVEQQGTATRSATLSMDSVPHLAQGRVIPPNREFLAVLGDQRSGTNIETPLETMVQAMMIALRNANFGGNREIVLQLDRRELGRAVVDVSRLESQRVGARIGGA